MRTISTDVLHSPNHSSITELCGQPHSLISIYTSLGYTLFCRTVNLREDVFFIVSSDIKTNTDMAIKFS